jgi:hypothetical protein
MKTAQGTKKQTREDWLNIMLSYLKIKFDRAGYELPRQLRVSVGFPAGSRGCRTSAIGQIWAKCVSRDSHHEIFISPTIDDPLRATDILAHECCHAVAGMQAGHGKDFRKVAVAIGLTGRMTATVASTEFNAWARNVITRGEFQGYPHARMGGFFEAPGDVPRTGGGRPFGGPGKQGTRMVKATCRNCDMIIRTTRKWIETTGLPTCACGGTFEE